MKYLIKDGFTDLTIFPPVKAVVGCFGRWRVWFLIILGYDFEGIVLVHGYFVDGLFRSIGVCGARASQL